MASLSDGDVSPDALAEAHTSGKDGGSLRKYLLYAIGEILLIMVGILLALQVNNWNEARKQRDLEQQSLTRLLEDLQQDAHRLHLLDTSYVTLVANNRKAIQLFVEAENLEDIRSLIDLPTWLGRYLATQTSTFDEMVNSGILYTIEDPQLLEAITNHYKNAEKYDVYTRENYLTVPQKWNQPGFAAFGIISMQAMNNTQDQFLDTSWIGKPDHPSYQAARFAIEHSAYILSLNRRIVQVMHKKTLELIEQIKEAL